MTNAKGPQQSPQSHQLAHSQHGIVVGIDGTETALGAVRWAANEAVLRRLPLRILHAAPYADLAGPAGRPSPEVTRARAILARGYTVAHRAQPGLVATTQLVGTGPLNALADASVGAELLVVGMRGTGALDEIVLGSVALDVSGQGRCPVVVVRGGYGQGSASDPVVVGWGDEADDAAIGWACDAAAVRGVPLTAVHALHSAGARLHLRREAAAGFAEEQERHLARWHARYPAVEIRRLVQPGRPADLLLAQSTHAQLVVVGSRGRGSAARALLGSTSRAVLRHCACPVAVIRQASDAPAPDAPASDAPAPEAVFRGQAPHRPQRG